MKEKNTLNTFFIVKPEGDPILTKDLIIQNSNLPSLNCIFVYPGFLRMPSWPGENKGDRNMRAGGIGRNGPDTRAVRDKLAGTGLHLSFSFRSLGV